MERLFGFIKRLTVFLFFIVLFLFAIVEARQLLYPLVLAVLFAYLLFPVCAWLEKKRLHRIPSIFLSLLLGITVIGGVVFVFYSQVRSLGDTLPELKEQAGNNIDAMATSLADVAGVSKEQFTTWAKKQMDTGFESGSQFLAAIFSATTGTIVAIGIMPVYVFCLLFYRNKLEEFFYMLYPRARYPKGPELIERISHVTKRYMTGVFIVVLMLCVINSAGLYLIGMKYALLLGILSAVCNFIPYFGTLIGAIFPIAFAVFAMDSPGFVVRVIILFLVVQFTENNILTPNITGGNVQINPFVTIVSIVAAGLVWGIPGMFVVIPVLGILKIILESDPETQPIAFLLGNKGTERHSITLDKIKRVFSTSKKSS